MKKKTPGVYVIECTPSPEDACEFEVHRKSGGWSHSGGRWENVACGGKAESIMSFRKDGEEHFKMNLCRSCVAELARSFITTLEHA